MGTYVYALNTRVRTISGFTVGHAEYRYKPSWGWDSDKINQKSHNQLCVRRIAHFDNNPSLKPEFFVMGNEGKLLEDHIVYLFSDPYVCFYDGGKQTVVGNLKKVGRSWTIVFTEEFMNTLEYKLLKVIKHLENTTE